MTVELIEYLFLQSISISVGTVRDGRVWEVSVEDPATTERAITEEETVGLVLSAVVIGASNAEVI